VGKEKEKETVYSYREGEKLELVQEKAYNKRSSRGQALLKGGEKAARLPGVLGGQEGGKYQSEGKLFFNEQ